MTAKLAARPAKAKSERCRKGNPNLQNGNRISPVMQKVRSLLPTHKPAFHLAILIDEPVPHCQKLLCGARVENAAILLKLLRSPMGREVLFVLMGEARPEWFARYCRQLDVNAARRQLEESRRAIEALQAEAGE